MSKKHADEKLITRNYNVELRANDDEAGIIEGTPIVFDQRTHIVDWAGEYDEIIDREALKKADLKDVRLFVNHDVDKITLARSKNGNENSTMSFIIDDVGLHIKAKLDIENNNEARALYSAIKRGDMDGMSFMFRIRKDEWKDVNSETPLRIVRDISIVHEVSVVNFPAYAGTSINARSKLSEDDYSPLAEARKAYSLENEKIQSDLLECEKLKYQILMGV